MRTPSGRSALPVQVKPATRNRLTSSGSVRRVASACGSVAAGRIEATRAPIPSAAWATVWRTDRFTLAISAGLTEVPAPTPLPPLPPTPPLAPSAEGVDASVSVGEASPEPVPVPERASSRPDWAISVACPLEVVRSRIWTGAGPSAWLVEPLPEPPESPASGAAPATGTSPDSRSGARATSPVARYASRRVLRLPMRPLRGPLRRWSALRPTRWPAR